MISIEIFPATLRESLQSCLIIVKSRPCVVIIRYQIVEFKELSETRYFELAQFIRCKNRIVKDCGLGELTVFDEIYNITRQVEVSAVSPWYQISSLIQRFPISVLRQDIELELMVVPSTGWIRIQCWAIVGSVWMTIMYHLFWSD